MVRRQFRVAPQFRAPRKLLGKRAQPWQGVCAYKVQEPSLPVVDLMRFMQYAHDDDGQDDETGFAEFGVDESCRDVVRSLRKVVQWRAPKQRTATQRIKDLVLSQAQAHHYAASDCMALETEALVLRINKMANKGAKHLEDSLRYIFRDLAIMPGGILIYPNPNSGFATGFVKFDTFEDLNSGMSQVLRLGMNAQECTVDELAAFHVFESVNNAAKSLADVATRVTPRPLYTPRATLQGTRLDSAGGFRTPRARVPAVSAARVPDLAAIGSTCYTSSRPCTAPTVTSFSDAPLQIAVSWQYQQPRPGTTNAPQRTRLRQERSFFGKQ